MSPVALLVSAMYWSWLWGLPGLLLATPLTACLKVAGDYIPALGFLSVLLGADRELDDYHDFYRMLLELDSMSRAFWRFAIAMRMVWSGRSTMCSSRCCRSQVKKERKTI